MTFSALALKTICGNWHRYTAYYLSSAFTVMIFFIYAAFIYHPDVVNGETLESVRKALIMCEYVIVIFSFFFTLYSNAAFLRARQQEFGLLSLFGMTRPQLNRLIVYETTLISLLAIGTGIGAGLAVTKLFFVSMAALLGLAEPMPYVIAPKALWVTGAGFFLLFEMLVVLSLLKTGRSQIVHLLKAAKKPKAFPVYSKWLVALAVLSLTAGYGLAWLSGMMISLTMLPILLLVVLGTYFLFTQGSVALLRTLKKKRRLYYRDTHLLTLSQLVFKLKDNARVLFIVAVLSAVVLTASGAFYTFYEGMLSSIVKGTPHAISFSEQGADAHDVITPEAVQTILQKEGAEIADEVRVRGLPAHVKTEKPDSVLNDSVPIILSHEMYNYLAERVKGAKPLEVSDGQTVIVNPYVAQLDRTFKAGEMLEVAVGGTVLDLEAHQIISQEVMNRDARIPYVLVVNDDQYRRLASGTPDAQTIVYYGYELVDWKETQPAVTALKQRIPGDQHPYFASRVEPYLQAKHVFSLTLFIGMFVSVLFFIASGSLLYFKLFTELPEERAQLRALHRIGFTWQEMKKVLTTHIALLFFLPFFVGVIHAGFAMKILYDLMLGPVWQYGLIVVGVFFIFQCVYFLFSRAVYLRQVTKGII